MAKRSKILQEILDSITPEEKARMDAMFEAHKKWHEEHPDHKERYGTDRSYWLDSIRAKGFNPIGITVMTCEETIIVETQEEKEAAWEAFKPEGWWYTVNEWEETRNWYVNEAYEGVEADAPKVYCLDERFKDIIK
jgi:hypothetical protein